MADIAHDFGPARGSVAAAAARPGAEVVPVRSLPVSAAVVAVAVALLAGAVATAPLFARGFFHLDGGTAWLGIDLLVGLAAACIIASTSPRARAGFSARFTSKTVLLVPVFVVPILVVPILVVPILVVPILVVPILATSTLGPGRWRASLERP